MIRPGSFVRRNAEPARQMATAAFDAVVRPSTGSGALVSRLATKARRTGASSELVDYSSALADDPGVRHAIAALRLIVRVGSGDQSALTPLLNKVAPSGSDTLMWDTLALAGYDVDAVRHDAEADLVVFFRKEIERAFRADGYSEVFEWLLTCGRVSGDSPALRPLLQTLVSSSVEIRERREVSEARFDLGALNGVLGTMQAGGNPHRVFASGAALLALATSAPPPFGFGGIELATFTALDRVMQALPNGTELVELQGGHARLFHCDSDTTFTLVHLREVDGRLAHGNGRYTRWNSRFELDDQLVDGRVVLAPTDIDAYLDERFGTWRTRPFFYHHVLDAPNTTIDATLGGLLYVYSRLRDSFANGLRHYADEWAAIMRDRFGINYSQYVPHGTHRKVLAKPVTAAEVGNRRIRLLVADYASIDVALVNWLTSQRSDEHFLVAGVTGHRLDSDANERLALANSLADIDHATLIESDDDLKAPIGGFVVDDVVFHSSAASGVSS
jgi:hypothetical protein